MAKTVLNMKSEELRDLIASVVEEKLIEMLGNPDDFLTMSEEVRERLLRQLEEVSQGERGETLDAVVS